MAKTYSSETSVRNGAEKIQGEMGPPVFVLRHDDAKGGDWEKWYLLTSDVHFDNPHCKRSMLKRHLDLALERNAGVIDNGDFFCAMQGKNDRRGSKASVRPEDQTDCYFDTIVDHAADFLAPYRHLYVALGLGNHETAIAKHNELNLTRRLAEKLGCHHGGFHNFLVFLFTRNGSVRTSWKMYMHHGAGGGGPVTKGVIQTNRRAATIDGVDAFFTGHIHEAWSVENVKLSLTDGHRVVAKTEHHIQTPTYKDEFGSEGFHIERGRPPKPLGGWWLRFTFRNGELVTEFSRAV